MKLLLPLLFCFTSLLTSAQSIPGLVAQFDFNNGVLVEDSSRKNIRYKSVSLTTDRFGNPQSACILNGNSESYLNLGSDKKLKSQKASVSLWFNMLFNNYTGQGYEANPILLTKNKEGDDFYEAYSIIYDWKSERLVFTTAVGEERQVIVSSSNKIQLGNWYHIVITYDNDYQYLYINGKLQQRIEKGFSTQFLETDSVMLGNTANKKNSRYFSGIIDDVRFYNRVLTADEVNALYNEPDPNKTRTLLNKLFYAAIVLVAMVIFTLLVYYWYRRKLRREQEKHALQLQLREMEMRMFKAQMNPHFIFNSMNSIQQFILENDSENANTYLVKFSRLLRKILESTTEELINIDDEAEIIKLYLEIEALRFQNSFHYKITVDPSLKGPIHKIPQMLIQSICENAVWHGLQLKNGHKQVTVDFKREDDSTVLCIVDDNGVGRQKVKSTLTQHKKKSLGLSFTHQRLLLMRKQEHDKFGIQVEDKEDETGAAAGTRVYIRIPYINTTNDA